MHAHVHHYNGHFVDESGYLFALLNFFLHWSLVLQMFYDDDDDERTFFE